MSCFETVNSYTANSLIKLAVSLRDLADMLVDSPSMQLKIMTPDGLVTDWSSGIVHPSLGKYYMNYPTGQLGLYQYEWISTGFINVTAVGKFLVNQGVF